MGYMLFTSEGVHCIFQLVSKRYENSFTIFTNNKSSGKWREIFGDIVISVAVIDRIPHHCTMLNIKGELSPQGTPSGSGSSATCKGAR